MAIDKQQRINDQLRVTPVRVVSDDGEQLGVLPTEEALEMARNTGLDLVEVAPSERPPVCRIMDFAKFKYDQEKKEREAKRHQKQVQLKEIRVKPNIEDHDYQVKLRHALEFLENGNKVKINLFFRGREMSHKEIGRRVLDRFINEMLVKGQMEKSPALEGRIMSMVFAPNSKKVNR